MGPVNRLEFPHQVVRSRFKEGKSIPSEQLVYLLLSLTVMAIITCSSSLPFDWLLGIHQGGAGNPGTSLYPWLRMYHKVSLCHCDLYFMIFLT